MVDVKIGITSQPVKRKIDEPLKRGYFLCSVQCPMALIRKRAMLVCGDDTREIFKSSFPNKRVAFEVQEYVSG